MTTVDVDVRPVAGHLSAQVIEQIAINVPDSSEAVMSMRTAQERLGDATRLHAQESDGDYSNRRASSHVTT